LLISVAVGRVTFTLSVVSLMVVETIKKNSNMNTISGNDDVEMAGISFESSFLNFDMIIALLLF